MTEGPVICIHGRLFSRCASCLRSRLKSAELELLTERTIHPHGCCTCHGEGTCTYCRLFHYRELLEEIQKRLFSAAEFLYADMEDPKVCKSVPIVHDLLLEVINAISRNQN